MNHARKMAVSGAVALLAISALSGGAMASSHREAPLISKDPSADNTDLYAFVSPDDPSTVTLIADYIPFEEPGGGPNFYNFDDNVDYWLKIDNTGDGNADVTYEFRFTTNVANGGSFLYSGYGPIPAVAANVTQTYDVIRNGVTIASGLTVPAPNIGPRTTPDYGTIASTGVHSISGGRQVFAGQRDDPFFADVGSIFDLGGLRPFNADHLIPLKPTKGVDVLGGYNTNSIALQVPKSDLAAASGRPIAQAGSSATFGTVGIWAGASRPTESVLDAGNVTTSGPLVQVSRLGNPLINEVLIGLGQKDEWNSENPSGDAAYTSRYTDPELASIIHAVYPTIPSPQTSGRQDLMLILGQGVPGLNQTNSGSTLYDMLRLNMDIPPAAHPHRLAVLKGDVAGFPNGRRLFDDVVDIELRAVADGYGKFLNQNFGLPNLKPNNILSDGCGWNDKPFLQHFPYVAAPWNGYTGGVARVTPCMQHGSPPANDPIHRGTAVTTGNLAFGRWTGAGLAIDARFYAS